MKIRKTLGAGVMSLGLVVGMAGFASATPGSATIDTTGPRSNNVIRNRVTHRVDVNNNTDIHVDNSNYQDAWTGDATVRNNTRGGDARSGNASNSNSFDANVRVNNTASTAAAVAHLESAGGAGQASISDTGPRSDNRIVSTVRTDVRIDNNTDIAVDNSSTQTATSGNATVQGNTRGGDAVSGSATNTNSTSLTFTVNN